MKVALARPVLAAACALAAAAPAAAGQIMALRWEEAFPIAAAPDSVHFNARFRDAAGAWHRLETWRNADRSLHRRTDDRIDLFALRSAGGEMHLRLLDRARRIAADVSRTNLYRIGVYADAFGLAHVIDRPRGAYQVETAPAPPGIAAADCRWRALVRQQPQPSRTLVCWSETWGLPLVIVDADATPLEVFRVEAIDRRADEAPADALPAVPAGYAVVDVNDEIDPAAD